jgi:hypothetical protein
VVWAAAPFLFFFFLFFFFFGHDWIVLEPDHLSTSPDLMTSHLAGTLTRTPPLRSLPRLRRRRRGSPRHLRLRRGSCHPSKPP